MKPLLDEAVSIINENECCYLIEGHTDSIGSLKYNQKLSERRAQSVYDYLMKNGAASACKLNTIGYGKTRPPWLTMPPPKAVPSTVALKSVYRVTNSTCG